MASIGRYSEIGSEFHWMGIPQGPFLALPNPCQMFASAREALLSVWRDLRYNSENRLFVPDYFCEEVVTWWEKKGIVIIRYADGPHLTSPDWETVAVAKRDAVLVVNYFGIQEGKKWQEWREANNGVLLIEDHSHDPFSGWASTSKADFAFASLRKIFPVPDGAILWSPRKLTLPKEPQLGDCTGSALKLAAMILKKDYLADLNIELKEVYRSFQRQGELMLGKDHSQAVSPWSRFLLAPGLPVAWREQRKNNVTSFLSIIAASSSIKPLFTKWPDSNCPFNVVLLFSSKDIRNKSRILLIEAGIYPSVHWEQYNCCNQNVLDLSNRIMTIPADHRYGEEDMKYIASILLGAND